MSFGQNISWSLTSRSDSSGKWLAGEGPPPPRRTPPTRHAANWPGSSLPALFVWSFNSFMKSPRFDVGDQIRTEGPELRSGSELPQRPPARPGPRPRQCHEVTGQTVLPEKICFCFTNKSLVGTLPAGSRPGLLLGSEPGPSGPHGGQGAQRGPGQGGRGASVRPSSSVRSGAARGVRPPAAGPLPSSTPLPLCSLPPSPPSLPPHTGLRTSPCPPPSPSILVLALRGPAAWGGMQARTSDPSSAHGLPHSVSVKPLAVPRPGGRGHWAWSRELSSAWPVQGLSGPQGSPLCEAGAGVAPEPS